MDQEPALPVRYIAEKLGASVEWDSETQTAAVTRQGVTMNCEGAIHEDRLMAPMHFFSEMFQAQIKYYPKDNLILMNTSGEPPSLKDAVHILPAFEGYSEQDLYWLSRIVEAEAMGEPYDSKLGVANVILNRKKSGQYPSSIKGVIFDQKYGIQFTPTANGAVYNTPSSTSYLAAIEALEGRNNASGALFFLNPRSATSHWIENNRQYAFTIGGHSYYY